MIFSEKKNFSRTFKIPIDVSDRLQISKFMNIDKAASRSALLSQSPLTSLVASNNSNFTFHANNF